VGVGFAFCLLAVPCPWGQEVLPYANVYSRRAAAKAYAGRRSGYRALGSFPARSCGGLPLPDGASPPPDGHLHLAPTSSGALLDNVGPHMARIKACGLGPLRSMTRRSPLPLSTLSRMGPTPRRERRLRPRLGLLGPWWATICRGMSRDDSPRRGGVEGRNRGRGLDVLRQNFRPPPSTAARSCSRPPV
jgi:hypothetical protein